VVMNDGESILDAIDIHPKYEYSFWDSLIIEAAIKSGSRILLSEDFSDGQIVDHMLKIKKPIHKSQILNEY